MMNIIEKIKNLRQMKTDLLPTCGDKTSETIKRAEIQGIDQIYAILEPAKVHYEWDGYADGSPVVDIAKCPNCEYEFEKDFEPWGAPFCPNCGQPLKWDEEGESE